MTRNLKALGLALAAAFAMNVVAASSASAHYVFTSAKAPVTTTGAQVGNHTFTVGGQAVQCTTTKFSSTMTGTEFGEVQIFPVYEGCTYAGGAKQIHPKFNGCTYTFTGATTADGKHGVVHIICPAGKVIESEMTNFNGTETCLLTIAPQTATEGYTAVNKGEHVDITATARIKLTPHGKGGCPLLVTGLYTGLTTLEGYEDGKAHGAATRVKISIDT